MKIKIKIKDILWLDDHILPHFKIVSIYSLVVSTFYITFGNFKSFRFSSLWSGYVYQYSVVFLLFFIIPLFIIKIYFKKPLSDYGLCVGNFKFYWKVVVAGIIVLTPILYLNSNSPQFLKEYPLIKSAFSSLHTILLWEALYFVYYIGWEFFFRGFLLFGLKEKNSFFFAVVYETAISTILHIGKPNGEIWAALIAGFVFAYITIKSKSIIPVLLLHFFVGMATDIFCAMRLGIL